MSGDIAESDCFEIAEQVVREEIEGESLLLDLDSDEYFALNDSARVVWQGLKSGERVRELVEDVCTEFGVEREEAASDVREFVRGALERGLIERSSCGESES